MKSQQWCEDLLKHYKGRKRYCQNKPIPQYNRIERYDLLIQLLEVIIG